MTLADLIKNAQRALGVTDDGDWGPVTTAKAEKYDLLSVNLREKPTGLIIKGLSKNPAYNEAKKFEGKGEGDSGFVAYLSTYWKKVGLPGYKTIIGSAFAWCGLFVAAMQTNVGQQIVAGAAGARNHGRYGIEVEYKKNGAPRGAIAHINHAQNCNSGSNNHVAFLDGDCTAEDLKPGKVFRLYGGNQGNTAKVSTFSTGEICEIRWPKEVALPGPVTKSDGCSAKSTSGESTR